MEEKLIQICVLFSTLFTVASSVEPQWRSSGVEPEAFHRYYRPHSGDNLYTRNWKEIGTTRWKQTGKYGYIYQGSACDLFPTKVAGTVPLYRMLKLPAVIHKYTTSEHERQVI